MILALLKYMFAIQPYYDYCVHMISKNYVILVQSRRFKGPEILACKCYCIRAIRYECVCLWVADVCEEVRR